MMPDSELFEFLPDPVFVLDQNGVFLAANAPTGRYLGRGRDELIGRSVAEIFPPEQSAVQLDAIRRVIGTGEDLVEQRVTPIGEETYVFEYRLRLLGHDAEGSPKVLGMVRDVTGIVALERQYAELYENATDALFAIDTAGRIRALNRTAEDMSGYRRGVVESLHFSEVVSPDDLDRLRQYFAARLAGGDAPTEYEVRFRHARGEERWAEVHISREPSSLGAFQASVRDITPRKRLECMRRDFLHMISHEIKTPLTVIHGFASAMASGLYGDLPPRSFEGLENILGATRRVRRLMEQFLLSERIEGPEAWPPRPGSVSQTFTAACDSIREQAAAKGIEIAPDVCELGEALVKDAEALRHILENLLSNAVKFTPAGGRVTVRADRADGKVRIRVEDTGSGIPEGELGRIFDRFFRGAAAAGTEGSGLGLHIVRRLVERADGNLRVESQPGRGTRFDFEIPESNEVRPPV